MRDHDLAHLVVEHVLDLVSVLDGDGQIVFASRSYEAVLGYRPEELIGRSTLELVHPDDREAVEAAVATGDGRPTSSRVRHRSGRWVVLEGAVNAVSEPQAAARCVAVWRDVSKRLEAEQALRASRSLLQAVADGTPDALFVKDREGRYLLINEAGARALGRTVEEVIGARDADLMPPEAAAALEESDRRVLESGETHVSEDPVGERTFLATKAPYRDADRAVLGVLGVAHDITERRRLEAELRQAQKMEVVGRLAGGVAHDFNNLLTVIQGFTELARQQLATGRGVDDALQEVTRAADQATALSRQLLSLSRRAPVVMETVDVNAVVSEMDALLRRVIGEDLRLVTVFGASQGLVRANRNQLEQVILNLAVNARDAMPSGGKLTIETADAELDSEAAGAMGLAAGPHVVLRVSDTGAGMDAETQARAFEPFFTTKAPTHGTGLGLATVYGIVSQSGGHIALRSAPGAGTAFAIHLPAAFAEAVAEAPEAADSPQSRPSGTILVAEDDEALRQLFGAALSDHATTVLIAGSGEDALELAELHGHAIDVLITDIVMPGLRGTELARRIRERFPGVRVILATGYTDEPLAHDLQEGDAVLTKPFTISELVQAFTETSAAGGRRRAGAGHDDQRRNAST